MRSWEWRDDWYEPLVALVTINRQAKTNNKTKPCCGNTKYSVNSLLRKLYMLLQHYHCTSTNPRGRVAGTNHPAGVDCLHLVPYEYCIPVWPREGDHILIFRSLYPSADTRAVYNIFMLYDTHTMISRTQYIYSYVPVKMYRVFFCVKTSSWTPCFDLFICFSCHLSGLCVIYPAFFVYPIPTLHLYNTRCVFSVSYNTYQVGCNHSRTGISLGWRIITDSFECAEHRWAPNIGLVFNFVKNVLSVTW